MVIWFIVGLSIVCVWIWGLLFRLEYLRRGHRTSENEQKQCSEYMVNTEDLIKEEAKRTQLILHS